MFVRTPAELGAVIRDRRKQLKFDQSTFSKKIGVSRQWVIEIERGHARAELGLVLRALDFLNINLDASIDQAKVSTSPTVDINAIVSQAKRRTP
jgi:y4mF family transcriptional regulator